MFENVGKLAGRILLKTREIFDADSRAKAGMSRPYDFLIMVLRVSFMWAAMILLVLFVLTLSAGFVIFIFSLPYLLIDEVFTLPREFSGLELDDGWIYAGAVVGPWLALGVLLATLSWLFTGSPPIISFFSRLVSICGILVGSIGLFPPESHRFDLSGIVTSDYLSDRGTMLLLIFGCLFLGMVSELVSRTHKPAQKPESSTSS